MTKIKSLIFDLDGTLINTAPDLMNALNFVLKENNLKEIESKYIGNLVGFGALNMIKKGFSYNGKFPNECELIDHTKKFLYHYEKNSSKYSYLYPGVKKTLYILSKRNIILNVCTNKNQFLANKVLKELKIKNYFKIILGSSNSLKLKPDIEMISFIMKKLKLHKNETIMVGDSINDIHPAKVLNIKSFFVTYGFGENFEFNTKNKITRFNQILKYIN